MEAQPWDRHPDEPLDAYKQFVVYRSLGFGRSLTATHQIVANKPDDVDAPDEMKSLADKWDWEARASEWDIDSWQKMGMDAQRLQVALLRETVKKLYESVKAHFPRPKTMGQLLDAINGLATIIQAPQPSQVRAISGSARPRRIGRASEPEVRNGSHPVREGSAED